MNLLFELPRKEHLAFHPNDSFFATAKGDHLEIYTKQAELFDKYDFGSQINGLTWDLQGDIVFFFF